MRKSDRIGSGEIIVEIATKQNSNLLFRPLGDVVLRGRWDQSNVRQTWDDDTGYKKLPNVVPGIFVCLDLKAKRLRAVDPLEFDENAETLRKVREAAKGDQGEVGPMPEIKHERLSETEIKTALWRIFEAVEAGHAVLIQGEFPRRDAILAMPGNLLLREGGIEPCYHREYSLEKPLPPWAVEHELAFLGAPAKTAAQ